VVTDDVLPPETVICLKPHGSVSFYSHGIAGAGSGFLLPDGTEVLHWRWPINITGNTVFYPFPSEAIKIKYPPDLCPQLPDLVPPGHSIDHLCDPASTVRHAAKNVLGRADLVICCGLRGEGPDTAEITDLLSAVRDGTPTVYVGTDPGCNAATQLKNAAGLGYAFADARERGEVWKILEHHLS
jgi:hypothetical protein